MFNSIVELLIPNVHAQAGEAQNPLISLMPFVIIFVIFYFLMIKPQKKKLEDERDLLAALKKGDDVYTKSGVLGKITGITDKIVTLEIAQDTKIKVLKYQIAGLSSKIFEKKEN